MTRFVLPLAALAAALAVGPAHGQTYVRPPTAPSTQPAVSPYLNLLHRGNPAVNYYGIVRPQEQTTTALQQLTEYETAQLAPEGNPTAIPDTGRGSRFMTYGRYFNNVGGRGVYPAYGAQGQGQAATFGRRPGT
jgi:hypothetical protein